MYLGIFVVKTLVKLLINTKYKQNKLYYKQNKSVLSIFVLNKFIGKEGPNLEDKMERFIRHSECGSKLWGCCVNNFLCLKWYQKNYNVLSII